MGHPDYVYKPWSEARRLAARARMKSIIAGQLPETRMRRLIDQVERHAYAYGYADGLSAAIGALNAKLEREARKAKRAPRIPSSKD